jgi:hypothetical protein
MNITQEKVLELQHIMPANPSRWIRPLVTRATPSSATSSTVSGDRFRFVSLSDQVAQLGHRLGLELPDPFPGDP